MFKEEQRKNVFLINMGFFLELVKKVLDFYQFNSFIYVKVVLGGEVR